jgi:hypothetical protein
VRTKGEEAEERKGKKWHLEREEKFEELGATFDLC